MAFEIRTLGDALGAEVIGLDIRKPVAPDAAAAIRETFKAYHLLCFRSAPLSAAEFGIFARNFGEPQMQLLRNQRHGAVPEVSVLDSTYRSAADKPDDMQLVRLSGWHTDDSYFAVPAKATMLQSIEVPQSGGQTRFLNMRKAYEDLPDADRARLDGLRAVHSYDTTRAPGRARPRTAEEQAETPDVVHPLIRTHDETGAKSFYYNSNRTDRIVDMDRAESDALLDWVHDQITQPQYRYDHEWRIGDILLWDNRCLVHSVNMDFPIGQARRHQRILLKGSQPI